MKGNKYKWLVREIVAEWDRLEMMDTPLTWSKIDNLAAIIARMKAELQEENNALGTG